MYQRLLVALVAAISLTAVPAGAGPIWPEGAAGRVTGTAETVTVPGAVTHITGMLSGVFLRGVESPDLEDMYLIRIRGKEDCNGQTFSASTDWFVQPAGVNDFNTQLWLFDAAGLGLLGNDDAAVAVPQSFITFPDDDFFLPFPGPGLYYLAITGADNDPLSAGGPIFQQGLATEISGPDGPGGLMPINDWTGDGEVGEYDILLRCASGVPEPGTALLLLCAACALRRRR